MPKFTATEDLPDLNWSKGDARDLPAESIVGRIAACVRFGQLTPAEKAAKTKKKTAPSDGGSD